MIHKIWANDNRFKPVEFKAGLNVIIAERSLESGNKDTRNGAGKTTFLNILHFCLGADLNRLSLPKDELEDWVFSMSLDLCGQSLTISRAVANSKIIRVDTEVSNLPILPEQSEDNILFYDKDTWKKLLGKCLEFPQKNTQI